MKFLDEFLRPLFPDYSTKGSEENTQAFNASLVASKYESADKAQLESKFTFLQTRDSLHIAINFGESDPVILNSANADFGKFTESLDKEALHLSDETISITVTINKTTTNSSCTIYDLECFVKTLNNYSIDQFFHAFTSVLENSPFLKFKVFNLQKPFQTRSLYFQQLTEDVTTHQDSQRKDKFESFKAQCHFANLEHFSLTPDDFKINHSDGTQRPIVDLLNRYSNLISIIYLFDITSIDTHYIKFKINGYKSISGKSDIVNLHLNEFDEYYRIYEWVYSGGNLTDKIGLARNIISLHFKTAGALDLTGNPFQSVKSSFKVYEKQNIKQYIEIRNKISDQLLDFNQRANKIVETFASGFQKSTLALISFYISAIVIRVLSKGEFANIFSLDATILSLAFLSGSIIYYWVSRWEIKEQRKRFVSSYVNLKKRYTDLLELEDINKILNNDNEYAQDLEFIDKKEKSIAECGWLLYFY